MSSETAVESRGRGPVVWVLAGLAIALITPVVVRFIEFAGHSIPQPDVARDWALGVIWAVVLAVGVILLPIPGRDRRALLVLWLAKCVVTLGFMLLYEARYWLDAYTYYAIAAEPWFPWHALRLWDGTMWIEAATWLHNRIVPGSYHAVKVGYAMVGLVAIYLFYRAAVRFRGTEDIRMLYVLGLFPSILFWSSILGKDPIVLLGIGMYAYGVVSLQRSGRLRFIAPVGAGVFLAMLIRPWLGPVMVLPLFVFALGGIRSLAARLAFATAVIGGMAFAWSVFVEYFVFRTTQELLQLTADMSHGFAQGGAAQRMTHDLSSIGGVISFMPRGAFTALFRPLPGEVMNPFGLLAGLESLLLLGLALVALLRFRFASLRDPIVVWAGTFVVVWAAVYGFVSYGNLGGAVRFRLQILPILLGLLLHLAHRRRASRQAAAPVTA
jgi:hypothetical protein